MALLELYIVGVTKTSISISADLDYWDYPYYMELKVNGVSKGQFLSEELDYYPITGLTPGTSYLINVTAYEQDSDTYIEGASKTQYTEAINYNPVSNLTTTVPSPRQTHTTWTKPTVDTGATFNNYEIYIKGIGVNEMFQVYNINSTTYDFSSWIYGCQTITVDVIVNYGSSNDSEKKFSSAYLGQKYPTNVSPLIIPFSEVDLMNKMGAVGEAYPLTKLSVVNYHDGTKYVGINRQHLPEFMSSHIEKLSDLEGYPVAHVSALPHEILIGPDFTIVGQKFTVSSRHRWKLKSTDITSGFFSTTGISGIESPDAVYSTTKSIDWTFVTENPDTYVGKGKLQFLYESVPCSGNFNTYMDILGGDGNPIANDYILVTQSGLVPPPDPDPGTPPTDTIESIHWVGQTGQVIPTVIPVTALTTVTTTIVGSTSKYRDTFYTPTIATATIGHATSDSHTVLHREESLMKTGRLAVDTTGGYSNQFTQGIIYSPISGVVTPIMGFSDVYSVEVGTDVGKIWMYHESVIKTIIDDERLHLLTSTIPTGTANSIYVPIYKSSDSEVLYSEAIYGNTAHVYVTKIKYLKLNLSAEHFGKSGITYKQRKVLSYDATPEYIYALTSDFRSDTSMPGIWRATVGTTGKTFIFPAAIYTNWD